MGAANSTTVSRTRAIARSTRHATEVVNTLLDASFVGKRPVATMHVTLLMDVSCVGGLGKGELGVDLEGMSINLLDCAIEDLGLSGSHFDIPLKDLYAISGDGSLGAEHLSGG